jgi:uncharacterized membrane protein YfhO
VTETQPTKVLQMLASEDFNPLQEVVLDRSLNFKTGDNSRARAQIVDYTDRRVTAQASLDRDGILVLSDSFYPGWHAYVDGKEAEILRANLFFRAVPLLAGNHVVEFRYEPRSFKVGLAISLLTAAGLFLWFVFRMLSQKS